jgi:hypothetical protein
MKTDTEKLAIAEAALRAIAATSMTKRVTGHGGYEAEQVHYAEVANDQRRTAQTALDEMVAE